MFAKLRQILGSTDPDRAIVSDVQQMMGLSEQLVRDAGHAFFEGGITDGLRDAFYATDRQVNALEQKVRRQVISRVTLSQHLDRPALEQDRARWIVLLGLVKDVERIGDHAKNLLEAALLRAEPPPDQPPEPPPELAALRVDVEAVLRETLPVMLAADEARARVLLDRCHEKSVACDALIRQWAQTDAPASVAVPIVLALRAYKRVAKHAMNILSTVTMPLDKVGYYE